MSLMDPVTYSKSCHMNLLIIHIYMTTKCIFVEFESYVSAPQIRTLVISNIFELHGN